MLNEASNQDQTQTGAQGEQSSQAVQGSESQTQEQQSTQSQAQQESAPQQVSDTIPRSRLNEVIAERNRERAEKAELLRALQQLNGAKPQAQQQEDRPPTLEECGGDYERWQIELGRFGARQEFKTLKQQEQQQGQAQKLQDRARRAEENWTAKLDEAAAKNPAVLSKLEAAPTLRQDIQFMLKDEESPIEIALYLADNPAEIARLNAMEPYRVLKEMGRIGAKLAAASGQPPKVSQMPKPIPPVGTAKGGSSEWTQDKVTAALYPM